MTPDRRRLRVAMYVNNDVTRDSRVLREADTLAGAGHEVTLVARAMRGVKQRSEEHRPSGVRIVRLPRDNAPLADWQRELRRLQYPWRGLGQGAAAARRDARSGPTGWGRIARRLVVWIAALPWVAYRLVGWKVFGDRLPVPRKGGQLDYVVGWRRSLYPWSDLAAQAVPDADVHHGHDLPGLVAAASAAGDSSAKVVYDSHEIYRESVRHAHQGPLARSWLRSLERRLARRCVALVTVNWTLEEILRKDLGIRRTVVVHNAPPRWTPPDPAPDLLRDHLGLPPDTWIALYHGRLSPDRGLEMLLAAIRQPGLEAAHAVFLGYGPLRDTLAELAVDPRYGGRVHVVDAVPPDELLPWVASADVAVMCIQPSTLNHKSSTPNKLFEALAAGVPVVASDFAEMRSIIAANPEGPLGSVCRPDDVVDVARALQGLMALPRFDAAALRDRCVRAAHERWNWESESARLVALYEDLAAEVGP